MKKVTGRILIDPEISSGKRAIKGTRNPVYLIIELLGSGLNEEEALYQYPTLKNEDIKAALLYAAKRIEKEGF
jgi:uncharacterized protein (DUF433 family)